MEYRRGRISQEYPPTRSSTKSPADKPPSTGSPNPRHTTSSPPGTRPTRAMPAGSKSPDSGPHRFPLGGQVGGQLDMRVLGLHPVDRLGHVDQLAHPLTDH